MASFAGAFRPVAPPSVFETDCLPEEIGCEVFGTPQSYEASISGYADFLELGDDGSSVNDESCVGSHPNLVDVKIAEAVPPHAEADFVAVVEADEEALLECCSVVCCKWNPTDFVGFEFRG